MSLDDLLIEALHLSRRDRARIVEALLSSLEEPDVEVGAARRSELEQRSRDVAEGRVHATGWESARDDVMKEIQLRRARRTAP
jgi:putative addiction module component (TIGR02574 family)